MKKVILCCALVVLLSLGSIACSKATSALTTALEAVVVAAEVAAPSLGLSPSAAAWLAQVPSAVTAILDLVDGTSPLSGASSAVAELEKIAASAPVSGLPDGALIQTVLRAISNFLSYWQAHVAPAVKTANLPTAYAMGFTDSPNAKVAKWKPSKADKAKAKALKKRAAAIAQKLKAASAAK